MTARNQGEGLDVAVGIPTYLQDLGKHQSFVQKSFETVNPEDLKLQEKEEREHKVVQKAKDQRQFDQFSKNKPFQKKLTKGERELVQKDRLGPLARKAAEIEHQRTLQDFNRFDQAFVEAYAAQKNVKRLPEKEQKAQKMEPVEKFVNPSTVGEFERTERLSKRLSRLGVASRRHAEKLIAQRMIQVDGKVVNSNVAVNGDSRIRVSSKTGMYTPMKEGTRIWLFHKPRGMVTTHYDPQGRVTVFGRLKDLGLHQHVISVGRLDYLSEGLLIITNDGELARALELPHFQIERAYLVRVFGRTFDDQKLAKIRAGGTRNGRQYGPYIVEVTNRQNTNTWLHMKLYEGKNNEIRRVMRKHSLRVNRLKRVSYGPYNLDQHVPNPNDLQEVSISKEIHKLLYEYYKKRAEDADETLEASRVDKIKKEKSKERRKIAKLLEKGKKG